MDTAHCHILIVDDNVKNLQLTAKILKDNTYRISLAHSGSAALELLNEIKPDLILLDIMMPGMDGIEVCRNIKKNTRWSEIPIVFLTAKNQTEDLVEGFRAGGVDYITKPFNQEELLARVKTHLELAISRKTIVELNLTRDKLYSIIAHDIRSPLASIIMTINLLSNKQINPTPDEMNKLLLMLGESARNTNSLLSNLLEWTKFQSGSLNVAIRECALGTLLYECTELLRPLATNKGILILLDAEPPVSAWFDDLTMHTVVRNLLSNAIKFTPPGGTITVSCKTVNHMASLSIADTGVGMSKEVIDLIFSQNEHYTSLGTNNERGTGLGLMMVKDFIQKNNGLLKVTGVPGEGTRFDILLPLQPETTTELISDRI